MVPGHIPGHTGYQIGAGADALLFWGNIIYFPGVQLDLPEVGMMVDTDKARAVATREAILDEAAADRVMIAGMHLDFPTFGHIRRHAGRYEIVPKVWAPTP